MTGRYDEDIIGYGYRKSLLGKYILQVCVRIQPCDIQSGSPDGPFYDMYRDARRMEIEKITSISTKEGLHFKSRTI